MFVLIISVVILSLFEQYGKIIVPNNAQRKKLGNLIDVGVFAIGALTFLGMFFGG
jgi:hypothetical protein